jgi:hypothetical protein
MLNVQSIIHPAPASFVGCRTYNTLAPLFRRKLRPAAKHGQVSHRAQETQGKGPRPRVMAEETCERPQHTTQEEKLRGLLPKISWADSAPNFRCKRPPQEGWNASSGGLKPACTMPEKRRAKLAAAPKKSGHVVDPRALEFRQRIDPAPCSQIQNESGKFCIFLTGSDIFSYGFRQGSIQQIYLWSRALGTRLTQDSGEFDYER